MLLGAAGAAHAVQDCELNGQSVSPSNGHSTAGKTGLMRCKDRDSGDVQREQELQNGVFMGVSRYYEHGQRVKDFSVNAKGNMQGLAREYASGALVREASYRDGSEIGLSRAFYPSGALRRATFYDDAGKEQAFAEFTERGQLYNLRCADRAALAPAADDERWCGFSGAPSNVEFFDAKGRLRSRASFTLGKRLRSETLYDNGTASVQEHIDGTRKTERRWSEDGVKRRETVWQLVDRGSIKLRESEYSDRGTLAREQRWSDGGVLQSDDTFYLNGQPRSAAVYAGARAARYADVVAFHDNGQRAAQGRYLAGDDAANAPIGVHQSFNARGTLVAESHFDGQGRLTRERSWDDSGQLQRDDEVFEDGSRKAYSK